jgi:hypothetical protein
VKNEIFRTLLLPHRFVDAKTGDLHYKDSQMGARPSRKKVIMNKAIIPMHIHMYIPTYSKKRIRKHVNVNYL